MINDTTTCEFMEDCLDMFLHLQLTQQGIPIFQHVQCLGEHFLKLHVCIILSEILIVCYPICCSLHVLFSYRRNETLFWEICVLFVQYMSLKAYVQGIYKVQ